MADPLSFERGTLWQRTLERTEQALRCGALHSIPTRERWVPAAAGVDFVVRLATNLQRKAAARQRQPAAAPDNPFLPYDEDLLVTGVSPTHVCLLNKYNVVDHHLLIVTRQLEEQQSWLTLEDFAALWLCLSELPSLGFYNAGRAAGASQRHKHLQLVPLPLSPAARPGVPIEPLLSGASAALAAGVERLAALPFRHAFSLIEALPAQADEAAVATWERYRAQLAALGLTGSGSDHSYNLLLTPRWMLLVPRSREHFRTVSVNALGFAGSLLARDDEELDLLVRTGPLAVLQHVAESW